MNPQNRTESRTWRIPPGYCVLLYFFGFVQLGLGFSMLDKGIIGGVLNLGGMSTILMTSVVFSLCKRIDALEAERSRACKPGPPEKNTTENAPA